jgi:RimJ/RimL family protein N-acetyltransferase
MRGLCQVVRAPLAPRREPSGPRGESEHNEPVTELRTDRLVLRQWRPEDREPFAAMNADPEVMRHFPAPLDRAGSDALAARAEAHIGEHGWGLWAVEAPVRAGESSVAAPAGRGEPSGTAFAGRGEPSGTAFAGRGEPSGTAFAGFVGLSVVPFQAHFTPAVEVGWRLAQPFWGHGYATEGARAALTYAFIQLELDAVVSFTAVDNDRSRRVMERLSMSRDPAEDFDHPNLPGSPVERHVLYRLRADDFAPPDGGVRAD